MTSRSFHGCWKLSVRVSWSALIGLLALTAPSFCQTQSASPPPGAALPSDKALAFDVVSIHPSNSNGTFALHPTPDGYTITGMPIAAVILMAYFPAPPFKYRDLLKGAPDWVSSDRYDIGAKVAPADIAAWQSSSSKACQAQQMMQSMFRTMLADRFQLRIHIVPSQMDGYALTLGKGKLKVEKETAESSPSDSDKGMRFPGGGVARGTIVENRTVWTFENTSMDDFRCFLAITAQGVLVNRTGLEGKFHFALSVLEPPGPGSESSHEPAPAVPFDIEALGLKLERIKVHVDSWVVDSIQRPSPN